MALAFAFHKSASGLSVGLLLLLLNKTNRVPVMATSVDAALRPCNHEGRLNAVIIFRLLEGIQHAQRALEGPVNSNNAREMYPSFMRQTCIVIGGTLLQQGETLERKKRTAHPWLAGNW
ncbi:uncharacterized protein LOC107304860 [Oryza brachyantha]|uniref:uncharacterized protein LOC107304860 n=1 Tax=Oryza brachyantha TaxID=4533 RepID=UPI0007763033|nr:uncharacterized protein LOC107304860 [Oryza brachyantha]